MSDEIKCSVCADVVTAGGRKGKDGKQPLCVRHYHRELRGSTLAAVAERRSPGLRVHATLPADVVDRMHIALAEAFPGVSVSEFIATAIVDAVTRVEQRAKPKQ